MIRYDRKDRVTGGTVRFYQHHSGFRIDFVQKRQVSNKFIGLSVPYGANHVQYIDTETKTKYDLALGTPYLTQQCLVHSDYNELALQKLRDLGINLEVNITRSSMRFSYTTVENYQESIASLLTIVLDAKFTQDQVRREIDKTILNLVVDEENLSSVGERVLMRGVYENPVIYTPAHGTIESLQDITLQMVEQYYQNAFHASRMSLILVGDFSSEDEEAIITYVDNFLSGLQLNGQLQTKFTDPSDYGHEILIPKQRLELSSSASSFFLAYKKPFTTGSLHLGGRAMLHSRLSVILLTSMLIGEGSNAFEELYNNSIIDESFKIDCVYEDGYAHLLVWGDSIQAESAVETIAQRLEEFIHLGAFDEARLKAITRANIGHFMRYLDDVAVSGELVAEMKSMNLEFTDYASVYLQLEGRELLEELAFIKEDNRASVVLHGHGKRTK